VDIDNVMVQVGFVLFTVAASMWAVLILRAGREAHRLHWLMLVLVVFKALTLLSQAGMYHLIRLTGEPEGWNVAFYIFTFMRGILFFVVCSRSPPPV
jgi:G protein-coupled receptor 107